MNSEVQDIMSLNEIFETQLAQTLWLTAAYEYINLHHEELWSCMDLLQIADIAEKRQRIALFIVSRELMYTFQWLIDPENDELILNSVKVDLMSLKKKSKQI